MLRASWLPRAALRGCPTTTVGWTSAGARSLMNVLKPLSLIPCWAAVLLTMPGFALWRAVSVPPSAAGGPAVDRPAEFRAARNPVFTKEPGFFLERATAKDQDPSEFQKAGVCARCHVVSVLEWGVSEHLAAGTDCRSCHGPSRKHVANERNELKPDRVPRGAAVARLCLACHIDGCPKTLEVTTCQNCHHPHALIHPTKPPSAKDGQLAKLLARWGEFRRKMEEGEKLVRLEDWEAARMIFRSALELIPGDRRARNRIELCRRRLDPKLPGFEIVGDDVDPDTGLPREVRLVGLGTSMSLVPGGEFDMGSDARAASGPVHTVQVDAFYLGKVEVTQAEWVAVMGTNPSAHQGSQFPHARTMPVERVSWEDCQKFVAQLQRRFSSGGFRLPTEAEWEYAASPLRPAARQVLEGLSATAWFRENTLRTPRPAGPFLRLDAYAPRPVGSRKPNARGFYDMQGNVSEWCSSLWRPYLYDRSDGRESRTGPGLRILRGGGFADSVESLDPTLRHPERPHRRLRWNGLRLARSVSPIGPD